MNWKKGWKWFEKAKYSYFGDDLYGNDILLLANGKQRYFSAFCVDGLNQLN